MPFSPATKVERGDLLTLIGASATSSGAAKSLGYADRRTVMTDMIFVGSEFFPRRLAGIADHRSRWFRSLSPRAAAARIMGLVFAGLRAVHPHSVGSGVRDVIFDTVGLTVFMACVGLAADPASFGAPKSGLSLVFVGLVIAVLPHTVAILFGRYLLKMNPIIVLGACSGAGTITAALRAIQERRERTPGPWLHRALCNWQYRAYRMVVQSWSP